MNECNNCKPGYCERHKMVKNAHLIMLCQTREDYRKYWDKKAVQKSSQKNEKQEETIVAEIKDETTKSIKFSILDIKKFVMDSNNLKTLPEDITKIVDGLRSGCSCTFVNRMTPHINTLLPHIKEYYKK